MRRLYGLLGMVGVLALAGSVLGYARNASITSVFGLSGDSDAYFVAIFLPNTLQAVLVIGALAPALVHVYVNYVERGKPDDARVTFSSVVNLVVIVVAAIVLAGFIFNRVLVRALAPGLPPDAEQETAHLMNFTLPLLLLLCLGALLGPILNTRDHFLAPALNSLVVNSFTVGFVIIGGRTLGVTAAAVGILAGGAAHVALLLFFVRRKGIAYSPLLRLRHPGVRLVLARSAPVVFYMAVAYCVSLLERLLASYKGEGAVTIITIATTLFTFPTIVFNASLGTVLYPQFVRQAATAPADFARALTQGSRVVIAVLVPATIMMMAASVPLTRLAYGPGEVASGDVRTGAAVLVAYSAALCAVGLTMILQKGIYAAGDFVTPLKVEALTLGLYAGAAIALAQLPSIVGLASARAGHHVLVMFLTFWLVRRAPGVPAVRELGAYAAKPFLAALAAVAFYGAASLALDAAHPAPGYAAMALEQCILLAAAGLVYLMTSAALGVRETAVLLTMMPRPRLRPAVAPEAVERSVRW